MAVWAVIIGQRRRAWKSYAALPWGVRLGRLEVRAGRGRQPAVTGCMFSPCRHCCWAAGLLQTPPGNPACALAHLVIGAASAVLAWACGARRAGPPPVCPPLGVSQARPVRRAAGQGGEFCEALGRMRPWSGTGRPARPAGPLTGLGSLRNPLVPAAPTHLGRL